MLSSLCVILLTNQPTNKRTSPPWWWQIMETENVSTKYKVHTHSKVICASTEYAALDLLTTWYECYIIHCTVYISIKTQLIFAPNYFQTPSYLVIMTTTQQCVWNDNKTQNQPRTAWCWISFKSNVGLSAGKSSITIWINTVCKYS